MLANLRLAVKPGGSMLYFNPKPDITTFELSRIWVYVECRKVGASLDEISLANDSNDPIYRHFSEEKVI